MCVCVYVRVRVVELIGSKKKRNSYCPLKVIAYIIL